MTDAARALTDLAHRYMTLHTRKEDLFWVTRMGLSADPATARQAEAAEQEWNAFLQDPARLADLRRLEERASTDAERHIARGWIAMLSAHTIESAEARRLSAEIVEREADLQRQRGAMPLGYRDPASGDFTPASSAKLALMAKTHADERVRRAAFDGLSSIEGFVLDHGFLDIITMRNRLARLLGFEDYYAWRVQAAERMEKAHLFSMLEDLARRTKTATDGALRRFAETHGSEALQPWNFLYLRSGRLTERFEPYLGFGQALRRWGRSFAALGVRYRGATLTLDLLDRAGKYENGFMHGPEPAFFDEGRWRPARINFTANAVVGQMGAGHRALQTLFHEGGHAAHFANVVADAPCFSHEFAPTSVAYAETQSMFMDSLIDDASWLQRYAANDAGETVPMDLVRESIDEQQPFRGWDMRAMLTVPFAERAIYELPESELTPDRVLDICRDVERNLQGLSAGIRPVLAVPHLLSGESSAYYHGYVLAEMAVESTRRFFLERDGYLTDNPRVGPELAEAYWRPGNAETFDQTLVALTGRPLSADALISACDESPDESFADAVAAADRVRALPLTAGPIDLGATISVVHGHEVIGSTEQGGFERLCDQFEAWVERIAR